MTLAQPVVGAQNDVVADVVELGMLRRPRHDVDVFKRDVEARGRFAAREVDDPVARSGTGEIVQMDVGPPVSPCESCAVGTEGVTGSDSQEQAGVLV